MRARASVLARRGPPRIEQYSFPMKPSTIAVVFMTSLLCQCIYFVKLQPLTRIIIKMVPCHIYHVETNRDVGGPGQHFPRDDTDVVY